MNKCWNYFKYAKFSDIDEIENLVNEFSDFARMPKPLFKKNNLKEVILQNFDNSSGNLLYVSGEIVSSNLDKDLISEGYKVKRIINYSVLPVEEIGEEFINNLKSSIPDMVYVYSENSAKNYLNLLKKYNLLDYWMNTNLMCLGEKTSSVLNEIKWKKIFLFNSGEEEFLLYKI